MSNHMSGPLAVVEQLSRTALLDVTGLGSLLVNSRNGVLEALNIPFAQPPLGQLRFSPPLPPVSWTGVRDATELGPGCVQKNTTFPVSEDCLQLNIWAPAIDLLTPRLPVFVWAFGDVQRSTPPVHPHTCTYLPHFPGNVAHAFHFTQGCPPHVHKL
jgi:hypothetical protein